MITFMRSCRKLIKEIKGWLYRRFFDLGFRTGSRCIPSVLFISALASYVSRLASRNRINKSYYRALVATNFVATVKMFRMKHKRL